MQKRLSTIVTCVLMLAIASFAADKNPQPKKTTGGPDKAYLQKSMGWMGWHSTAASKPSFMRTGPHLYFDLAPLKYASWDEYSRQESPNYFGRIQISNAHRQ